MNFFHSLLKTVICLITAGVIFVQDCLAQDDPTSIQAHMLFSEGFINANSPDAWSMIKYGDANVNLYTGSIGLSIPVYTYQDEDFTIPISLDYATTGYKPNVQTGILGMGWYLNVGGAITREVRGVYDEEGTTSMDIYSFKDKWEGDNFFEGADHVFPQVHGFGALYNLTNFSFDNYQLDCAYYGKAGEEYLPIYVHPNDLTYNNVYETRPDIFHFNFLGHTGSFILQPNNKVIVYESNHPAKEYSIDVTLVREGFTSFIITTGDMMRYYFTKVELAESYCPQFSSQNIRTANGWKLTKIEAPNGRTIDFIYNKSYHSFAYIPTIMDEIYNRRMVEKPNGSETDMIFGDSQQNNPTINEVETACLTSISIDGRVNIAFSYSDKKRENGLNFHPDIPQKLDRINIYNNSGNLIKTCECKYSSDNVQTCSTYDPLQPGITFLKSIFLSGEGTYNMQYNEAGLIFPPIDTYGIDWYGYYNNTVFDYNFMPSRISARANDNYLGTYRQPKLETTKYGILTDIEFPTGGSSHFEYEQNTYSTDITGFYTNKINRPAAGLRIAQIKNFDVNGEEILRRSFSYIDINNESSGQLLWRPVVYSRYISSSSGYLQIDRETISSSSDFPYSQGSHIEYLRIIEERIKPSEESNKTLTEYKYNSAWNSNCRDDIVSANAAFGISESGENEDPANWDWDYNMSSTLNPIPVIYDGQIRRALILQSRMGGKLQEKNLYKNDLYHPSIKESYEYSFYNPSEIPYFDSDCMWLGYKIQYRYSFNSPYLQKKIKSTYNDHDKITTEYTNIEIDSLGRQSKIITTDSKNKTISESYFYHPVVPSYLTEHIVERDDKVISANKYNFQTIMSPHDKYYYVPLSQENGIITPETTTADLTYYTGTTYDCYDSEGRPLQITDKSNKKICIVWGYGGLYPIAKIENMTHDVLADQYGAGGTFDGALPTNIETNLRAADNVMVTTYTYKPLVGITSMTDPSGRTTTYEYDNNGKLIHVRDDENESVKSYEYNIVSENQ